MTVNRAPLGRSVERAKRFETVGTLQFDFADPEPESAPFPPIRSRGLSAVKQAIVRWLEKEL